MISTANIVHTYFSLITLSVNSQIKTIVIHTKHIDICHHLLRDMVEDKDTNIKYIRSEENPAYTMKKNCSEDNYVKHMERIK